MQNSGLLDIDDRVDAESADPLFHPPADILVYLLAKRGILPVEIRLLLMEDVHIELVRARQLLPAGSAKIGPPVGGKLPLGILVPQVEEAAVLSVRILAGLPEPLVLIRAVVDHQVHQDRHVSLLGLRDQLFHVFHGAESGVDRVVVRNIISLIRERRLVDRREPHNIDSQVLQVIQLADNTLEVPDPVSVAVHKALGVDLIGYFVMPPLSFHICLTLL